MSRTLSVWVERWPIAGRFRISRGTKTEAVVVVVEITEGRARGRGEAVPYARYGETVEGVVREIEGLADATSSLGVEALARLGSGAARNAVDCALWDLEAKRTGKTVAELAGLGAPKAVTTAITLGADTPEAMAEAAVRRLGWPWLKLKVTGEDDLDRVRAVHEAAPSARLVVDANESWDAARYVRWAPVLAEFGVALLEQPLPAGADEVLGSEAHPIPVCADESCHDRASLDRLGGRYDAVNVKLDKTGGLTEALALVREARARGLGVMVGCMVCTSLGIAPALLVAQGADVVDLDGALLLARDRAPGIPHRGAALGPAPIELWG